MTTPTFTEGQRVYHRGRKQFGTYVMSAWRGEESIVDFPGDDRSRVTTAQLVAADKVEENS